MTTGTSRPSMAATSTASTASPTAPDGDCESVCGDGVILPGTGEACDDGNAVDVATGAQRAAPSKTASPASTVESELPEELVVPVIYRDFRSRQSGPAMSTLTFHPDFNPPGIGEPPRHHHQTSSTPMGKPVFDLAGAGHRVRRLARRAWHLVCQAWYRTSPNLVADGNIEVVRELTLTRPNEERSESLRVLQRLLLPARRRRLGVADPPLQELP